MIAYTVRCTFTDQRIAEQWIAWLRDEHIADVIDAGASGAAIVKLDGDLIRYEVRYRFPTREAFDIYERVHAPHLRAEGLARFPLELGLTYERSVGTILLTR